jgi:hypothetical protein
VGPGDVEALDGGVEEVPAHVGDVAGDDLVAGGLGGAEVGGVGGGGQPGAGQLAGQPLVGGCRGRQRGQVVLVDSHRGRGRGLGGRRGCAGGVLVGRCRSGRLAGGAAGRAAAGGQGAGRGQGDQDGASHG